MNDLKDVIEFAVVMGVIALFVLVVTGGIAFLVRTARRGAAASAVQLDELRDRLAQLERSVDVVAVEVERVGEAQRYTERVLARPDAGAAR